MKKLLFIPIFLLCFAFNAKSQIQFGAGASYFVDEPSGLGIQGKGLYVLNEQFDIAGGFTFWLQDFVDYSINADLHYKLLVFGDNITLSPMAGIDLTRVEVFGFGATDTSLEVGAFFKIPTEKFTFYAEPKLVLGGGSGLVLSGGILF